VYVLVLLLLFILVLVLVLVVLVLVVVVVLVVCVCVMCYVLCIPAGALIWSCVLSRETRQKMLGCSTGGLG
jgi:hypothetical protein